MIKIQESGLTFGPFIDDDLLYIEKYPPQRLKQQVKLCEFVWWNTAKQQLVAVEAKSSVPDATNDPDAYAAFWRDINEKFDNAFQMITLAAHDRPQHTTSTLPASFQTLPWPTMSIVMYVVIPKAPDKFLAMLTDKLRAEMSVKQRLWQAEMFVINRQKAAKKQLV
jgi:hypothetical protein